MKPTTKAELALNGMVELASLKPSKPMALSQLAEKQAISLSYLEQVFASLRRAGLVLSVRGPGGGYLLSRSPGSISAGEIISAVDVPADTDSSEQVHPDAPEHSDIKAVDQFWTVMKQRTIDMYHQVSLQEVAEGAFEQLPTSQNLTTQAAE